MHLKRRYCLFAESQRTDNSLADPSGDRECGYFHVTPFCFQCCDFSFIHFHNLFSSEKGRRGTALGKLEIPHTVFRNLI